VSAGISDGQLVVRLSTPNRGDAPPLGRDYRLSGHLTTSRHDDALAFRGCGQGCFVAPAGWRGGDNVLTLRVGASG
jgi:copper transport protein